MEKWEIEVKEHWNKIPDSEWYQSLRTDDRLSELYNNPETAFHPGRVSLQKYIVRKSPVFELMMSRLF